MVHPPPCGEAKPNTPRFYNGPNGERWVTARQEGVKGVGLKYVGTRKIVAVVRRPTKFSLTTKYRRLMEWMGKVSGDSHQVLEHLRTRARGNARGPQARKTQEGKNHRDPVPAREGSSKRKIQSPPSQVQGETKAWDFFP